MEASLTDQYCADPHECALTAAASDPESGAVLSADEWGTCAITRPGDRHPSIIFDMGAAVHGAVAVCVGGALVAVGDDDGTVAVFNTTDGACVFEDVREGESGATRAMRAMCFNPQGNVLATLAIDGVIRVFDLQTWERVANYQGFGGASLEFDRFGDQLLAIDSLGQPKLLDMRTAELIDLELVAGGVRVARFTSDGKHIVAIGQGGLTLIALPDGQILDTFAAKGSSGMVTLVLRPDGRELAAVTARSVHVFSLPELQHVNSERHGAPHPTGAALWDERGVQVAGTDGHFHRPGGGPSLGGVICCGGFGEHRVAVHSTGIAIWRGVRRRRPFLTRRPYVETRIDRDGRLVLALPQDEEGLHVYDARTGQILFDTGPDTAGTPHMEVGGSIVACMLPKGGLRWYELRSNQVFTLDWVSSFALSGSGTWMAVVTPKGEVRVLDPNTGEDAVPAPKPLADVPIQLVAFVNRKPHMLVLDADGVLGHYDLTDAVNEEAHVSGREVLDLNVQVDRLWGLTGGKIAALRFQDEEAETATVIFVDLEKGEVVSEVSGLLPYVWVDPETGHLLQPARGGAIVELDPQGVEVGVLRSLPEGEWLSLGPSGVLDASEDALS